jgi:trypsin
LIRKLALVGALLASLVVGASPANAVTDGSPDNGAHPWVGLMVAKDAAGEPLWRCSGTLLSSTVFLTAGHCTESTASAMVWFDDFVPRNAGTFTGCAGGWTGYPCTGGTPGATYLIPGFDPNAFFVRDAGIVVLSSPVVRSTYGVLPALNSLDALKVNSKTTFTSVGYGLQASFPDAAGWKDQALRLRMVSHPQLVQINGGIVGDFSLLLSNNANTGGTCFGDSGGPNFLGNTNIVAGVTSFGLNSTCGGTGGIFRMDRSWSRDWVLSFL